MAQQRVHGPGVQDVAEDALDRPVGGDDDDQLPRELGESGIDERAVALRHPAVGVAEDRKRRIVLHAVDRGLLRLAHRDREEVRREVRVRGRDLRQPLDDREAFRRLVLRIEEQDEPPPARVRARAGLALVVRERELRGGRAHLRGIARLREAQVHDQHGREADEDDEDDFHGGTGGGGARQFSSAVACGRVW